MVLVRTGLVTGPSSRGKWTLTTLPPEIIGKITNHLGQSSLSPTCPWNPPCARHTHGGLRLPHREKADQSALYNLCLTSRRMHGLAAAALYSVVTLTSGHPRRTPGRAAIYRFLRTLVESPHLRHLVRHLSCHCYEQGDRPPKQANELLSIREVTKLLTEINTARPTDLELLRCAKVEAPLLPTATLHRDSLDQRVLCAILLFTRRLETLSLGTLHIGSKPRWHGICANNIIVSIGLALEAAEEKQLPALLPCLRAVKLDDNIHTDDTNRITKEFRWRSIYSILLCLPAMSGEGIDMCLAELV